MLYSAQLSIPASYLPQRFIPCEPDSSECPSEILNCLLCNSSQPLGRGLRRGLRAGPASEEEAAPQSHNLHCGAAGGAGEGLRTHALSRHLHAGGAGPAGQADGGSSSGQQHARMPRSTSKLPRTRFFGLHRCVDLSWVCVLEALNCRGLLPDIPYSH